MVVVQADENMLALIICLRDMKGKGSLCETVKSSMQGY